MTISSAISVLVILEIIFGIGSISFINPNTTSLKLGFGNSFIESFVIIPIVPKELINKPMRSGIGPLVNQ